MYNVNPFDLIISEPVVKLQGDDIHNVIGFEIELGEEQVLFRGTYGECQNFISSVENNAMVKIRHYHKLMDKVIELTDELSDVRKMLHEYEDAYDRLLADYQDVTGSIGQIDRDLLLKIATGKTGRCDAIRVLVESLGMDYYEARQYVHEIMREGRMQMQMQMHSLRQIINGKEVMQTEIRNVGGHYEVYDNGKFLFSADNKKELEEELQEMQKGN